MLNQFYPPDTAATGQLLADVAEGLAARGHEVHVVCSGGLYGGGGTERGDAKTRGRRDAGTGRGGSGVRVHRLAASSLGRARRVARLCDWGSYYVLALQHSMRLGRMDVCLALTTPPFIGLVGARLKRAWGTRLVLWSMDVWPQVAEALGNIRPGGVLSRVLLALAARLYAQSDAIVSLGPVMSRRLTGMGVDPERIVDVHNWAPGEAVRALPPAETPLSRRLACQGAFTVMYSGNIGLAHEFETILAAAEILQHDASVVFVFVGAGKRRAEVVRAVRARRLSNVRFADPEPLERLSELLAAASVHLVSMRSGVEGLLVPSKIYGILASGRPAVMVGPRDSEIAQLLSDSGSGVLVEIGQAGRLVAAIRRLRDRPELAAEMGRAGRRYYERNLGRDRSVRLIVDAMTNCR